MLYVNIDFTKRIQYYTMRKNYPNILFVIFIFLCQATHVIAQQAAKPVETLSMQMDTARNLIPFASIPVQKPLVMGEDMGSGRGVAGMIVTKVVQGIQQMIDNRQKKYVSEYSFALQDENFYHGISAVGPFDPTAIKFKGFTVARIYTDESGKTDTAFVARFALDTSRENIQEILNNGIFRLRLESFSLRLAKVKVPDADKKLNMDFEISIVSSYLSENGTMNPDVTVGKFVFPVRNAPLDEKDPAYATYYKKLEKSPCIGQSFLVPRSAGYYNNGNGFDRCWGVGLYTVKVNVKESSKNTFIDKVISFGSDDVMSIGNDMLRKKYGYGPARVSH